MTQSYEKKTALACDQCRRQKRKCDGQTPKCMACERGSIECTYTATLAQRKQPQRNYVAALEARVALLEKILKDAETNGMPGSSPATGTSGASPHQTSETIPDSSPIGTPTMNPIPTLVDDAADILTLGPTIQVDSFAELDLGMEGYETLLSLEHEHKLLAQFWDWQRMHHPYVAPVPFLSSYAIYSELVHPDEPIPSPPPPPPKAFAATALNVPRASNVQRTPDLSQYISPLLLYSMFAIAALFHGDVETGEIFYERARGMVFMEAANPRVATVQAICLMATWELGYARSPAAWTLIGVAWSLCIRLGLNVDSTLLLRSGAISQRLYETRNFVMWAVFNTDRLRSTCMGMRPLIDRRAISTPRHSSPSADTVESRNATSHSRDAQEVRMTWWSPSTLGMGDVLVQAAWDTLRELIQMMDNLFDSVYATDASTRTPQEILELVAQNHLTIQKFIDKLPTWLRSTGAIRRKESGLVYMHLFIHLTSILTNRPFLSSHHSPSDTTRKYRTLAFRIARASALQVSSLIRHIPLSSPCVTMPYIVYSACTVLLLAPEDPAALDGVRTGLACLNGMDETGYWADSAKDAARRVRALAERWGVELSTSRRVLGLVGGGIGGGKVQGSSPGGSEPSPAASTRPNTSTESETTHIPSDLPSTSRSEVSASGFGTASELDDVTLPDNINAAIDRALQAVQPSHGDGLTTEVQDQPARLTVEQIEDLAYGPTPFHIYQPDYLAPQSQLPPRANTYHPYRRDPPKKHVPHVAYANSHADLQHDMHVPHSHWHSIIQPADPTDPSVCSDIGSCFSYTVEHAMDPAFVDRVGDPYAGVAMDWGRNAESGFPRYAGYGLTSRLAEGFGETFSGYGY